MSNAWNRISKLANQYANAGGIFIRLTGDGDKIVGAFAGEPYAREVHWNGEGYDECQGDGCAHCAGGMRPSLRVMLNFYVPVEDRMKVIEGGTVWFQNVLKIREKYGLDKWLFEIERHGEKGDTKTKYTILPEEKIDDELHARIAETELHALGNIGGEGGEGGGQSSDAEPSDSDGPIDPRVAGELVAMLKAFPRSDVDAFLAAFKVQRVRDLRTGDEDGARAYIEKLTGSQAGDDEIDPFA